MSSPFFLQQARMRSVTNKLVWNNVITSYHYGLAWMEKCDASCLEISVKVSDSVAQFCLQAGMVEFVGLIKVNVVKGTNLAVRDVVTSDPYVVLALGQQVRLSSL